MDSYKIGVDGGGMKTECILIDVLGAVAARHTAAGCNPSLVGPEMARKTLAGALQALLAQAQTKYPGSKISATLLCMAGSPPFWREAATGIKDYGTVTAVPDSLPVLELATGGAPGLVLHAGTGSFVTARAPDGSMHYAGGLGWRFGDSGSGHDRAAAPSPVPCSNSKAGRPRPGTGNRIQKSGLPWLRRSANTPAWAGTLLFPGFFIPRRTRTSKSPHLRLAWWNSPSTAADPRSRSSPSRLPSLQFW
jgi:hypothetical protein